LQTFDPVETSGSEIRPYTQNFAINSDYVESPVAWGGTCPAYAFQLAYNQFSSNTSMQTMGNGGGEAGGNARRGARKMIVFETDGVPNQRCASTTYTKVAAYTSYYAIRQPTEYPSGVTSGTYAQAAGDAYTVVQQICALDSAA